MHGSFVPENLNCNSFHRLVYRNILPIFALTNSHMNKKISPNKHSLTVCAMSHQLQNTTEVLLVKEDKFIYVKYIQKIPEPPLSRTIQALLFAHVVKTVKLENWRIIATFPRPPLLTPISVNHLGSAIISFNDELWCASVRYNGQTLGRGCSLIVFRLLQQLQSDTEEQLDA